MRIFNKRLHRLLLAGLGLVAIVGVFATVQLTTQSASAQNDALRSESDRASRGGERTEVQDVSLAAEQMQQAADKAEFIAPADQQDPTTTTTAAPTTTTTAPPTTTTTARPTTTTTAAPKPKPTTPPPPPTTKAPAPVITVPPAESGANSQAGGASYYAHIPGGCAHRTLPKGTVVTVTNTSSGKTATCVVNDRGPFVNGRIIDLDITVFKQLASTSSGVFSARISW